MNTLRPQFIISSFLLHASSECLISESIPRITLSNLCKPQYTGFRSNLIFKKAYSTADPTHHSSSKNVHPPKLFVTDAYRLGLPAGHRYPGDKYTLTRLELQKRGILQKAVLSVPRFATRDEILTVHCPLYFDRFSGGQLSEAEIRRIGFPWSQLLVDRTLATVGGTLSAMFEAWRSKSISGVLAGGTHHAYRDFGSGFCCLNDIAVAAAVAMNQFNLERILVLDLDVHQGDATASIFMNEPRVRTVSFHAAKCFPFRKQVSTVDVEFEDGAEDEPYLAALEKELRRSIDEYNPQIVFYQAGVDSLHCDALGRLKMSRNGLQKRNQMVYEACQNGERTIPLVCTMGGGYSRPIEHTVMCHADVFDQAVEHHYKVQSL